VRRIIHAVKGWMTGGTQKGKQSAIVYIFEPGKEHSGGEVNPNDQVLILRRLSNFVGKENTPVTIIFPGRPSRKIPDGAKQGDVQARYATTDQLKKVVIESIAEAKKKCSAVLATNNPNVEKYARSERIRHIRATTFEASLDTICGPLRREQPQQQPRRQPQQQQSQQQQASTPSDKPQQSAPTADSEQSRAPIQPQEPATAQSGESNQEAPQQDYKPRAPRPESSIPRLRRYEPPLKKEERNKEILDLIDPL
jgi:hypothetical protein